MASFGFTQIPCEIFESRKRERSPSEGHSDQDTYQLCSSLTGKSIRPYSFTKDWPEEERMLRMGIDMAILLGAQREQIKMHKELDVRSGECKVHVTVVSLEDEET